MANKIYVKNKNVDGFGLTTWNLVFVYDLTATADQVRQFGNELTAPAPPTPGNGVKVSVTPESSLPSEIAALMTQIERQACTDGVAAVENVLRQQSENESDAQFVTRMTASIAGRKAQWVSFNKNVYANRGQSA